MTPAPDPEAVRASLVGRFAHQGLAGLTDEPRPGATRTITDAHVAETIDSLGKAGITITKEKLFDLTLINELYQEFPDLKVAPA